MRGSHYRALDEMLVGVFVQIVLLMGGNCLLELQSWTKVLGHFCVSREFFNSHRSDPSPHPTNNVERMYPEFFLSFNFV